MPLKADKLEQTIDNLQLFLAKENFKQEDLANISRKLTQLNDVLTQKKLTVQIVSDKSFLSQALFDLINTQEELDFFELKFDSIPKPLMQVTPQQSASLEKLSYNNCNDIQQHWELSTEQELLIGRSPKSDVIIDPDLFYGVSWNHGVIKAIKDNNDCFKWQICDRNSTNGTFVNGEQITDCQFLKSGDVITLAYPQKEDNVVQLTFNSRITASNKENREYWDVVDCDLLFVVADGKQSLTPETQEFLQNLDLTYISQQFLVVNVPDPKEPEDAKIAEQNVNNLETWLKNEVKDREFELIPLYLKPYYKKDARLEIDSKLQKKQERFSKILDNIFKHQLDNILAKRIATKLTQIAEPIEPVLEQQQIKLADKIKQEERELAALSKVNFKEISKKAIAQAHQDQDKFFKQVKLDIAQSKAALLDIYSKRSVNYKIQNFVEKLTPTVSNKNGKKIIQLKNKSKLNSNNINISLIDFSTKYLETWANEEWFKICYEYNQGGLNNLFERISQTVNIIPNTILKSLSVPKNINIQDNFLISFAGTNCETIHKQKSLGAYILKQLRSQMMQVMMMLTLILGFVGINANRGQMMKGLSSSFQQYPLLFGLFVCSIIFLLIKAYNHDNNIKIEEAEQKIKKDLSSYYQSFTKNLLEKIIQDISLSLESEEKRITNSLEIVNSFYAERILETEKQKITITNNLRKYQIKQKNLKTEVSEFKKIKRALLK